MKHILFVIDYYSPHRGGIENVFENVISRLLKKWYEISVLTSHFDQSLPLVEPRQMDGQAMNLRIYRTGSGRLSFLFCAIKKWIWLLRSHRIDVIHASTYGWAIPGSILWLLFSKKVVLTVHEVFGKLWNIYKWKIWWCLYRLFERSIFCFPYDSYHCVSRYTMNSLRILYWISDRKLKMIYNGVDCDFWDPKKVSDGEVIALRKKYWWEDKFVVLYYGHAGKSKGIDYLIEAVPWILALDEKIVLVFNLIESNRTEDVKVQIASLRSQSQIVVFDGFEKEELRRLVASVDCVVAPSISEGFGSVHTEVCAMEKPLITTDVASIPEVVSGNLRFVPPGNAKAIVDSVSDCLRWAESTIIPKKLFSWDETVEKIEKLY